MNKIKTIIYLIILGLFGFASIAVAQIGGGISTPSFFKKNNNDIELLNQAWTLRAQAANFTNLTAGTFTVSGNVSGDMVVNSGFATTTISDDGVDDSTIASTGNIYMQPNTNGYLYVGTVGAEAWGIKDDGTMMLADATTNVDISMNGSGDLSFNFATGDQQVIFGETEGIIAATSIANNTTKGGRFGTLHYDISQKPFYFFTSQSSVGSNVVNLGGGTGSGNAATSIRFMLAPNNTTASGNIMLDMQQSTPATITATTDTNAPDLYIRTADGGVDNAGTGGNDGEDMTWIMGAGSDALVTSGGNGGNAGNFILSLADGGAGDGAGTSGYNSAFLLTDSTGNQLFKLSGGGFENYNGSATASSESRSYNATARTTNTTATTINSIDTTSNTSYVISAQIVGIKDDGSVTGGLIIQGVFENDGGVLTQVGNTTKSDTTWLEDAGLGADFNISGTTIEIQAVGLAATNFDWSATYDLTSISI